MKKFYLFFLLFVLSNFFSLSIGQVSIADDRQDDIVDQQFIVELEEDFEFEDLEIQVQRQSESILILRKISQSEPMFLLQSNSREIRNRLVQDFKTLSIVKHVFKNEAVELRKSPDDPKFSVQWTMGKIGLEQAWEITTGGTSADGDEIIVAVLDDGFDIEHEDLIDNWYNNPHDQAGDMNNDGCPGDCGVDDDGDGLIDEDNMGREPGDPGYNSTFRNDDDENGYKDDTRGLNPKTGTDTHPYKSHGSSVAGIVGAKGDNGIGVTGVNWNVKILPISEGLTIADVIEAYNYLADLRKLYNNSDGDKGTFIVSCNFSAGISNAWPDDYRPWCDMYDIMGEQGILNVVAVPNAAVNIDNEGDIPSLCESEYMIAVTSTNEADDLAEAGFGSDNVDIAAPGEESYTVDPILSAGYGSFPGTSAATPHVAGAIGLLYSIPCDNFLNYFKENPSKVDSLATIILRSGDPIVSMKGLTKSETRLNVYNTMIELSLFCGGSTEDIQISNLSPNPATNEISIEFSADPREEIYVEIYNILGQKMSSKVMNFPLFEEPKLTVNTEFLNTGMYFISLVQGKKRVALKFYKA